MFQQVDEHNFEEQVLRAPLPVLVQFKADWCGYCKRLAPAVQQTAQTHAGTLAVKQVDMDASPALLERFGVEVVPTFLLFRGGSHGELLVNPPTREALEAWLAQENAR